MNEFNPPQPTTIRKTPISFGMVVDLQHEDSGNNGFISGPQCWYRVGGELNREMVVPTLSNSPIGHEIINKSQNSKVEEHLTTGTSICIRSIWQSPVWPAYKPWQYLGVWEGDDNANYYHIDDNKSINSIWTIDKILEDGTISPKGETIFSGDKIRLFAKTHKRWLANSNAKHLGEHHPIAIYEANQAKRIDWVIWAQGTAAK